MARTKTTPGPKPRHGERRDFHIRLPLNLADKLEKVGKTEEGISAYVEKVLSNQFAGRDRFHGHTMKEIQAILQKD